MVWTVIFTVSHCKNKCIVLTHLMCVNQCPHFLHGFSCVFLQHTKTCVAWVLNINKTYALKMMLKIITRCINIYEYQYNIIAKKKKKKKNSVVLAEVTFYGEGFEHGTFELPILAYLITIYWRCWLRIWTELKKKRNGGSNMVNQNLNYNY